MFFNNPSFQYVRYSPPSGTKWNVQCSRHQKKIHGRIIMPAQYRNRCFVFFMWLQWRWCPCPYVVEDNTHCLGLGVSEGKGLRDEPQPSNNKAAGECQCSIDCVFHIVPIPYTIRIQMSNGIFKYLFKHRGCRAPPTGSRVSTAKYILISQASAGGEVGIWFGEVRWKSTKKNPDTCRGSVRDGVCTLYQPTRRLLYRVKFLRVLLPA